MPIYNSRYFIRAGGAVAPGGSLLSTCTSKRKEGISYPSFANKERDRMEARVKQNFPEDGAFGGTRDATYIYYIVQELLGRLSARTPRSITKVSKKLQATWNDEFGKESQNLSVLLQIVGMKKVELKDIRSSLRESSSHLFRTLHCHMMQGFYGRRLIVVATTIYKMVSQAQLT